MGMGNEAVEAGRVPTRARMNLTVPVPAQRRAIRADKSGLLA